MMVASSSTGTRSQPAVDIATLEGTHAYDLKLDGIRVWVVWDGETCRLINRSGIDISDRFPEIVGLAPALGGPITLDGEVVANDGRFSTVAQRDKLNNPRGGDITAHPCRFIAFDLLSVGQLDYKSVSWWQRREALDKEEARLKRAGIITTACSHDPAFFEAVRDMGGEGVVAKRLDSPYRSSPQGIGVDLVSKDWIKFKVLHSISCLALAHEVGKGGGFRLRVALLGPDGPVPLEGAVGTGFTQAEARDLKRRIDDDELFVVEIGCTNISHNRALRFPVYKGVRTDKAPADCTLDQLDTLPSY